MIEVLENKARKEVERPDCKSVLGYDPCDVKVVTDQDIDYHCIQCPLCFERIVVKTVYPVTEWKPVYSNDPEGRDFNPYIYTKISAICPECKQSNLVTDFDKNFQCSHCQTWMYVKY